MATAGARAQKPVGSAAWISTEKENITQLVNQEIEEIEYPVRHEMDWLNEHMADVFSNNQFNFAEVFKTPGKLRGKTPRTVRKRNVDENRVPLSEIFGSAHNQGDNESNASPARSPTKPIVAPIANTTPTPKAKETSESTSHPQYPDLSKNLNSFPKYNTDSGYHGMPDDEEEEGDDDDDDMVLTQVQPESQTSTQPLDNEPAPTADTPMHRSSIDRRTTVGSFHSAQEDVRQRGETAEPMNAETTPKQKTEKHSPRPQSKEKEPKQVVPMSEPISEPMSELVSEPVSEPEPIIPEPVRESSPEHASEPHLEPQSSPAKVPAAKHSSPPLEEKDDGKEDTTLDNFDDIGSPSDGSTPERPTIRKSSLSFASLPAREPLMKKSLGGSRISRTSHIDIAKINAVGSSYLGRQTGGHRATQAALEANPTHDDKMDIDGDKESLHEDSDTDTKASKRHNMSSTQRLHEKISMLGKLQPSRPTKSIPSVSGLSSAHVAYPELPTAKLDSKPDISSQKSLDAPALEPMATDEEEWIKPLNSPQKSIPPKSQAVEVVDKHTSVEPSRVPGKENSFVSRNQNMNDGETARTSVRNTESVRGKSTTPVYSSPQRPSHQKSASVSNTAPYSSTTPVGSPARQDGPLSASKMRLQSIMRSAKGLFTNSGSVSAAAKLEASSPDEPRTQSYNRANSNTARGNPERQLTQVSSPPRQEGRRTRSSTEREEKRKQKEREDRQREEEQAEKDREEEQAERDREEERQRALQLKVAQEKSKIESEGRPAVISGSTAAPSQRALQLPRPQSKEPEPTYETGSKVASQVPVSQQQPKQNDRRPVKPTREALQKPKPQPVSIRVGSALSRQIPLASTAVSSSAAQEPIAPPPSTSKQPTLKKKASNSSLHTASSNSSFKSSVSSQTQRKTQLASERKREQDEREARRKEEQRREMERKRAAQQSRAEAERRERLAAEDPKKVAQMQAIEKRRQENARRLERQGSQQPSDGRASILQQERAAPQPARPASRLGSIQPFSRSINQPQPNPAKPPKRGLDDEASVRPAASQPGAVQPPGESKRRRTDDEHNPMSSIRPTMAPPIRQSGIRKESMKPSIFGHGQPSVHQSGSSIFKTAQPQKPAHPIEMAKYTSGKIPFAEPSNPTSQPSGHKTPGASSSHVAPAKPSPHYPNGENIHLPEIATDSEDEDSDAEMLPVPKWAQTKELETILRQQEGMEADSIFGPIAPFSLEETFKADKKIKKYRDRTSSANWSGADGLTQEEIRKDLAERQRLRLNGGWTFGN